MSTLIGGSFASINNPKMEYMGAFDGTNISANLGDLRAYIIAQGWSSTCSVRQHVVTPTGSYAAAVITTYANAKSSALAPVYSGYIVAYNQSTNTWSTVVGGFNQYNPVIALNASNNTLYYAKGYSSGGSDVYSYNFSTGVSTMLGETSLTSGHYIYSMTVDSANSLYVGGIFTQISYGGFTSSSTNIGKLDGSTSHWTTVGTSPFSGASSPVRSLKANGTNIYAGSTKLYMWTGSAWGSQLGSTSSYAMMDMALNGSDLYIAAWSTVYKWNGTTMTDVGNSNVNNIHSIAVYSSALYVGMGGWPNQQSAGWYVPAIPDYQTSYVNSWGFAKTALASINWTRISGSWPNSVPSGVPGNVYSLYVANSQLTIGGDFRYSFTSATYASGLAKYVTSLTSFLGSTHQFNVCAVDASGNIYAALNTPTGAGSNTVKAYTTSPPAYSTYVSLGTGPNALAKWNGTTWTNLCSTTNPNGSIEAMAIHPITGDLYVAGSFTTINGVSANRIAKWNGTTWSALGAGLGSTCYALHFLTNTSGYADLYVGGGFTTAGGSTANYIARWSGSSSVWQAIVYNSINGVASTVTALESKDGALYVSGYFSTAGGVSTPSYAAKWYNNTWTALPSGGLYATSLVRANNKIYFAGGDTNVYCFDIAGNSWSTAITRTTGGNGRVLCIADKTLDVSSTNPLFIGFESTSNSVGSETSNGDSGVVKWDGTALNSLGSSSSYVGTNPTGDRVSTIVNYAISPTVSSGTLTASNVGTTSLTLSWTKATDGVDAQSALQYRIYASTNTTVMETVSAIEQYGTPLNSYDTDIATKNLTGLTAATTYIFNVIVKNTNGGKAVYTKLQQATAAPDTTSPVPGDSGTITPSAIQENQMTLSWTKATDNVSAQAALQYLVYKSTNSALSSVAEIEANGVAVDSYASDISTKVVPLSNAGTTYYFNVIVKDEVGNKAAYNKLTQATADLTAPTVSNGTLTPSGVTSSQVTLSWAKATDNVSSQANLQYLAYYSASATMDSVANIEANGTAFGSYASDIATKTVTGLSSSTTYYFNVIVKDQAGNKTAYTRVSQITSDVTAPTPANSGTITTTGISGTSVTLNWTKATDNITVQANLQYLAYYSTNATLDSVANIEANGTPVGSYAADINEKQVTGLSSITTYYFNVIVKDQAGNKAAYAKKSEMTLDVSGSTPGNGGALSVTNVTSSGLTLNWTKAVDDLDPQSALQYLAYYSTDSDFDSVENVETSGTPVGSYATDIATKQITGLNSSTTYYLNVIVKDTAGNKATYVQTSQRTADVTAPVVGASGLITTRNIGGYSVTIDWTKATDDVSAQAALQYQVYYSLSSAIDTVSEIESNGLAVGSYTADINTKQIDSLNSAVTYYFNVIVKDEVGNKAAYTKVSAMTLDVVSPTPGSSGGISVTNVSKDGLTLNWTTASDNADSSANLQYLAYYSTNSALNSVVNIETNGTAVGSYTNNIATKGVTGLLPNTTYYFNVIVKDTAGNKSSYTQKMQKTDLDVIIDVTPDLAIVTGPVTWGNGSALTLSANCTVTSTGDLTLDITDLDQIAASGSTRLITVETGGSIRIKNKKKFTVRPKTKYRLKIKV